MYFRSSDGIIQYIESTKVDKYTEEEMIMVLYISNYEEVTLTEDDFGRDDCVFEDDGGKGGKFSVITGISSFLALLFAINYF